MSQTPEEIEAEIEARKEELRLAKVEKYLNSNFRYVACDPDTRKAAYVIIDKHGKLLDSWTLNAKSLEHSAIIHGTAPQKEVEEDAIYVLAVESQQYYKGDDPRMVKSLLTLGRACGMSMSYLSRMYPQHESIELVLPRVWTKGRPKQINQFWAIKKLGLTPLSNKTYSYAEELLPKHTATEQKHLMDAVAIAQYVREEHQKRIKKAAFAKGFKG